MPRQPTLALGLLLALILAPAPAFAAQAKAAPEGHRPEPDVKRIEAEAAHGEKPAILDAEPSLAIYTVIVFVILLAILGRFAWKPLLRSLHERESHLNQVLLDAEKARNEAEEIAARHRRELAGAADEVRALIERARQDAQAQADAIAKRAQEEAEAARARAERDISGARDQALMEIWSKTADLAVSVAGRVLAKELGESDHRRLVEVALNELPADAGGRRDGGRS